MKVETFTRYHWTWKRGGSVEAVECMPTARAGYLFVLDPEDTTGGSAVYSGSLYETPEKCWDSLVEDAERAVKSAQDRLDKIKGDRTRWFATCTAGCTGPHHDRHCRMAGLERIGRRRSA